jgi:hypothetical protein
LNPRRPPVSRSPEHSTARARSITFVPFTPPR